MNKRLFLMFFGLAALLCCSVSFAGTIIVSLTPVLTNGNVVGYTVSNSLVSGNLYDSNMTIIISAANNQTTNTVTIHTNPHISNTINLLSCGTSQISKYNAGNITFTAQSPPCVTYYANTISLSPSSNTFNYSYGSNGNKIDIKVNSSGWKVNKNLTLNFTQSYSNSTLNLTVNPPKLSALNYYNKTISLNYSQNFTDQQLNLEVTAPKEPTLNKVVNVTPSWTGIQPYEYDGLNLTINVLKIPPLNITRTLAPNAVYSNSTYGIDIKAMNVTAFVFNTVLEGSLYANSPYAANCQHSFTENGTIICFDNLSAVTTGQLIASHNISGGVTSAFLNYQTQCRSNYTGEVQDYNALEFQYTGCQKNLTQANIEVTNSNNQAQALQNDAGYGGAIAGVVILVYIWGKRKNVQKHDILKHTK